MPMLRSWVTEVWAQVPNLQFQKHGYVHPCADMELNFYECYEAYGLLKGHHVCYDFLMDFKECYQGMTQLRRKSVMRSEAVKQIIRGERKASDLYGPEVNKTSYVDTPLNP